MPGIHEQATLTSKGQITLPKAIRQALGVSSGNKVTFEIRDDEVVVSGPVQEHEDPAIGAFLALLEQDLRQGKHIGNLPDELAETMQDQCTHPLDTEIEGDVDI